VLKERSRVHKVNQESYAVLFKALMADPHTAHEMVEISGLHIITVQHLMRIFKRHKIVHIVGWEKDSLGRDTTPVFAFGTGRDTPRTKLTQAQRTEAYRQRQRLKLLTVHERSPQDEVSL
jgi:hypothetical protein